MPSDAGPLEDHPAEYPLDGVLDLHVFHPRDAADVTAEYLRACRQRGVLAVRIIHGKGTGVLRARVHKLLAAHPHVRSWSAAPDASGWGATLVNLSPPDR